MPYHDPARSWIADRDPDHILGPFQSDSGEFSFYYFPLYIYHSYSEKGKTGTIPYTESYVYAVFHNHNEVIILKIMFTAPKELGIPVDKH